MGTPRHDNYLSIRYAHCASFPSIADILPLHASFLLLTHDGYQTGSKQNRLMGKCSSSFPSLQVSHFISLKFHTFILHPTVQKWTSKSTQTTSYPGSEFFFFSFHRRRFLFYRKHPLHSPSKWT